MNNNITFTYQHPHILIYVENNTVYTETLTQPDTPVKFIQCGAFASGRDNQLLYCTNIEQSLEEFGNPNYRLYGQAGYNVDASLSTGYAAGFIMRVMPDDATYANVVITAKYKVEETTSTGNDYTHVSPDGDIGEGEVDIDNITTVKKFHVSYHTVYLSNITNQEEFDLAVKALCNPDPDDDGYVTLPLFVFRLSGRGKYGNGTRIRLTDFTSYDDDEEDIYKLYRLDVLQPDDRGNLVIKEKIYGGLDVDLFNPDTECSLYLEDLVNSVENGSTKIQMNIIESTYEDMIDTYNKAFENNGERPMTASTFDPLFLKTTQGNINPNIVMDATGNGVDLSTVEGIVLSGGSDGSFNTSNSDRNEAITSMLVKAYNGDLDVNIKRKFICPADYMLDANFDESVKRAMSKLALIRMYDAMCYIDCGLLTTTDEILNWLEKTKSIEGSNIVKQLHCYKIRDSKYTGKSIAVTTTYHMASLIPTHFKTVGIDIPMAMEYARITNAIPNSFLPVITPEDDEIKDAIYKYRANYYEAISSNVFQRGTAVTTTDVLPGLSSTNNPKQKNQSDLIYEFNTYLLHLGIKIATDILYSKLYKIYNEDERAAYKEEADRKLEFYLSPYVRSATVDFEMSEADEKKSVLRLILRLILNTVPTRGIIELYIDPRA